MSSEAAAQDHAALYPKATTTFPKAYGPAIAPVKTPTSVIPEATAGAEGFFVTTANWNSPGQPQARVNPRATATSTAQPVRASVNERSTAEPTMSILEISHNWSKGLRSARFPSSTRVNGVLDREGTHRSRCSGGERRRECEDDERTKVQMMRITAFPDDIRFNDPHPDERSRERERRRHEEDCSPAEVDGDHRQREACDERGSGKRGLLDTECGPQPMGHHVVRETQVRGDLTDGVCDARDREPDEHMAPDLDERKAQQ
jgi:hypothetical protein